MTAPKRATVNFEADVHRALRLRAAADDRSMSDMANDAVKAALAEDVADLEAFEERRKERSSPFERFVNGMTRASIAANAPAARCCFSHWQATVASSARAETSNAHPCR